MAPMHAVQRPGTKGVFISGMSAGLRAVRIGSPPLFFSRRGSEGFFASAGMAHTPPSFLAPSIRPAAQN